MQTSIALGIESSCDETAVAIIDSNKNVLAHVLQSSLNKHQDYGGVVPEIAARSHLSYIDDLIKEALKQANINFSDINYVGATCGPGLIGGVMVGMMAAKTIAFAHNIPFVAINHLEAHALVCRLNEDIDFPYLLLLMSGGHCQILICEEVGKYKLIGETMDDALGEVFDKFARMLSLGYPGGPIIEEMATKANKDAYQLNRPLLGDKSCNFSFSGLKTKLRQIIEKSNDFIYQDACNLSYAFQRSAVSSIKDRLNNVMLITNEHYPNINDLVLCGGVAANKYFRDNLQEFASNNNLTFNAPALEYCTDNGVMIAWATIERARKGLFNKLDFKAKPRWHLADL